MRVAPNPLGATREQRNEASNVCSTQSNSAHGKLVSTVWLIIAAALGLASLMPALPPYNGLTLLAVVALILSATTRWLEYRRDRTALAEQERHHHE